MIGLKWMDYEDLEAGQKSGVGLQKRLSDPRNMQIDAMDHRKWKKLIQDVCDSHKDGVSE